MPSKSAPSLAMRLSRQPWRPAERPTPHEYIAQRFAPDAPDLNLEVREALKTDGYWKEYRPGRRYRYVDLGGFTYWVMWPFNDGLINRVRR